MVGWTRLGILVCALCVACSQDGTPTTDGGGDGNGDDCVCDGSEAVPTQCDTVCNTAFEVLFDGDQLAAVYLTIEDASWDTIASCQKEDAHSTMRPPECGYQHATFHMEYATAPGDADSPIVTTPEI